MIVVDASTIIEVLLRTPEAAAIRPRLFGAGQTTHAPHLLDVEVAQVIRRFVANSSITADRGRSALVDLADLRIRRYPHRRFLPRIWALRHNLSAYDAAYVALAEALDAELLTRDKRLAAAVGHRARIAVI